MVRETLGPSWYLQYTALPEVARAVLARDDNGIVRQLVIWDAALFRAASEGKVAIRAKGPWALFDTPDAWPTKKEVASNGRRVIIPSDEFTRTGLASYPTDEALGPGEDVDWFQTFPRWEQVEVCPSDMERQWPRRSEELLAVETMKRLMLEVPLLKYKELISRCRTETPCSRTAAVAAKKALQGGRTLQGTRRKELPR